MCEFCTKTGGIDLFCPLAFLRFACGRSWSNELLRFRRVALVGVYVEKRNRIETSKFSYGLKLLFNIADNRGIRCGSRQQVRASDTNFVVL